MGRINRTEAGRLGSPHPIHTDRLVGEVASEYINVQVVTHNETEHFRVGRSVALGTVMDAYCSKNGHSRDAVRFLFDGAALQPTATPAQLEMSEGDVIDAMVN
ncbi:hypothetical protein SAVIM338S_03384 [Streptomyces avidinii]